MMVVSGSPNRNPVELVLLNPEAMPFKVRDPSRLHQNDLYPDLGRDWAQIQQVQAGGVGDPGADDGDLWRDGMVTATVANTNAPANHNSARQSLPALPFHLMDDLTATSSTGWLIYQWRCQMEH